MSYLYVTSPFNGDIRLLESRTVLRPYLAVSLYEGLSGLMLLTLLLVAGIAQFRSKPFAIRIPFIVGTLALGGLFRGIDE